MTKVRRLLESLKRILTESPTDLVAAKDEIDYEEDAPSAEFTSDYKKIKKALAVTADKFGKIFKKYEPKLTAAELTALHRHAYDTLASDVLDVPLSYGARDDVLNWNQNSSPGFGEHSLHQALGKIMDVKAVLARKDK